MAVIFLDSFTGSNGTDLTAHAPDVGGGAGSWAPLAVLAFEIQSNKAVYLSGTSFTSMVADVSDADVQVDVDIDVPNASDYSYAVVVRALNASNHWYIDVIRESTGTPRMRLSRVESGGFNVEDEDTNVGAISGTTINLRVVTNGNSLDGYLDGVLKVSFSSAFQNSLTKHGFGLYASYNTTGAFDNFTVDSDVGGGGGDEQPTMRRWGGVPSVGGQGIGNKGSGRMWGRSRSGLTVPRRLAA